MIRRDIRLADGAPGWLLIAQRDHAHVSATLASCIAGRFKNRSSLQALAVDADAPLPPGVRMAVLAAVYHHDDGWDAWEAAPELDANGRPMSFTEISSLTAIEIWSRSIDAVRKFGPLTMWLVAGHFARLAAQSGHAAGNAPLTAWQNETDVRRREWLAEWQQADPKQHTRELADEALQLVWTFDEVSLWLCCSRLADEPIPCAPQLYRVGRGTPFEMELSATDPDAATSRPWRFAEQPPDVTISGLAVPVARYPNPDEMLAESVPHSIRWRLSAP